MTDVAAQHLFAEALPQAAAYAENPEGWLVLTGPSGSGKTHLAAAIANRCIERQQTAFFIMVPDLLDHLRGAYSPSSEISYDELFDQVRNAPVLVLDDFGAHSSTPWAQEKLFQVVNHRHNNSLPTVVTVRGPLTRLDESIRTRLEAGERSTVLQLGHFNSRLALGIGEVRPEMLSRMTSTTLMSPVGLERLGRTRRNWPVHCTQRRHSPLFPKGGCCSPVVADPGRRTWQWPWRVRASAREGRYSSHSCPPCLTICG